MVVIAASILSATLIGILVVALRVARQILDAPERPQSALEEDPRRGTSADRFKALEREQERLVHAIAEGIERTDRSERRIRAVVSSARKLVRESGLEHEGIEVEYRDLHEVDGGPGDPEPVPNMPENLELSPPSSIPGVSLELLHRARGIG